MSAWLLAEIVFAIAVAIAVAVILARRELRHARRMARDADARSAQELEARALLRPTGQGIAAAPRRAPVSDDPQRRP